MNSIAATSIILALSATALAAPAAAAGAGGEWRAYVCRVTDWPDCTQDRNGKRIHPEQKRYPDEKTCLEVFGQRFESDPAIAGKYPQTTVARNSFVFGCEQAR